MFQRPQIAGVLVSYKSSFAGLPNSALAISAIVFLNNSGRMVSSFLAIYLLTSLDLSQTWIGVIVTSYGSGLVIGAVTAGWFCERLPPQKVMIGSLIGSGVGIMAVMTLTTPWPFMVAIFICAIFEGGFRPPTILMLMQNATAADRPRRFAVYQTAQNLGFALSAAAGGLIAMLAFSAIFVVDGLTCLAAAIVTLKWTNPTDGRVEQAHSDNPSSNASLWAQRPFLVIMMLVLLNYGVFSQRLSTYPLYLTTAYGLSTAAYGAVLMINSLAIAGSAVFVSERLKDFDQRHTAALGSLLLCGSFAMLPASSLPAYAFLSGLVMTVGEILFMPTIVALVYRAAGASKAGIAVGIFYSIASICRAFGPLVGLWLASTIGSAGLWWSCGLVGIITALTLLGATLPEEP